MNKKVLITGAGGAIGVHILKKILEETTWDIIITDSFKPKHKGYLDRITTLIPKKYYSRIETIIHDLVVPFSKREVAKLKGVNYIINLASLSDVSFSIENPVYFIKNNVDIVLTMLELARKIKPDKFIMFSTDEVYGQTTKDSKGHKEWSSIIPSNPYSASKASQEAICIAYWRSYNIPLIITNTMNNFGETQSPSKFPAMIQNKLNKGETIKIHCNSAGELGTRYYIHSENTADAILFILKNVDVISHKSGMIDKPQRINIVGDKQVNNLELAKIIAKIMKKELKYELFNFHKDNPGHDIHYGLDGSYLQKLGWKSPLSFVSSLKKTIKWQQENKEWI